MSFKKVFNSAEYVIKTTTSLAIKNGMDFTVQVVPLQNSEGEFPSCPEVYTFIESYILHKMAYKPLNPRALESLKKEWEKTHGDEPFVPNKQPSELIVALIAASDQFVHVFLSVPTKFKTFGLPTDFINSELKEWSQENRTIYYVPINPPDTSTTFKYRDYVSMEILQELKKQGIYNVDDDSDSDDDMYLYYGLY